MKINKDILDLYKYFVIERNRIYKRRFIDVQSKPWTEDDILQKYRFTNIKRTNDRETIHLLMNITNNDALSYRDKLFFSIMFRTWNKWDTFKIIIGENPIITRFNNISTSEFESRINSYQSLHPDYKFFTDAFMVSGFLGSINIDDNGNKIENSVLRPIYFGKNIIKSDILDKLELCKNDEECYNILFSIKGLSKFLAYQIYVDFTYIKDSPFCEDNFVIAGPGCKRGIDFVADDINNHEKFIIYIRDNQESIFLPYNLKDEFNYNYYYHGKYILSLEDIENSFCEFSKYYKILANQSGKFRLY